MNYSREIRQWLDIPYRKMNKMGEMKDLSIEADEICLMCDSEQCKDCRMLIRKDGMQYVVSGRDRSIISSKPIDIRKEGSDMK